MLVFKTLTVWSIPLYYKSNSYNSYAFLVCCFEIYGKSQSFPSGRGNKFSLFMDLIFCRPQNWVRVKPHSSKLY